MVAPENEGMDKNNLRENLRTMLQNIVPSAKVGLGNFRSERHFLGDDSYSWMYTEGEPPIHLRPDPSAQLGPSFGLVNEGSDAFDRFIEDLRTDSILRGKISTQALEKSLEKLLRTFRDNPDALNGELDEAIQAEIIALRSSIQKWTSLAPIDFLVFEDIPELSVGKVVFRPTASLYERALNEFNARIDQVASYSSEQKQQMKQEIKKYFDQTILPTPVCAEVTVEAEASQVQQLAASEIDVSLNLLRCYTYLLFDRKLRARMGLRGENMYVMRPIVGFAESDPSWVFNFQSIGILHPFTLSTDVVELLNGKYSLGILSQTLAKLDVDRSKLERAVVTSIRWLGRSVMAPDLPEKVLNLAAASERLLTGDDEDKSEIAERFARRLAFLIRDRPEDRLNISIRARELYKVRNKVIHAGKTDVDENDVKEMEILTFQALVKMAHHLGEWSKHEQFSRWVEAKSYNIQAT
jgi:hypothetical protein